MCSGDGCGGQCKPSGGDQKEKEERDKTKIPKAIMKIEERDEVVITTSMQKKYTQLNNIT